MSSNDTVKNRHGSAVVTFPSDTEYLITRKFDAPAELIFKAHTTPELVKRWWGFETSEWLVCDIDLRVGGKWRYVTREVDADVGFHGEYREVDGPHRLVYTEIFEGTPDIEPPPDAVAVDIMTLDEVDGVTTMTLLSQLPSQEIRDLIIATGMEEGMQISYNRLEDLVRRGA